MLGPHTSHHLLADNSGKVERTVSPCDHVVLGVGILAEQVTDIVVVNLHHGHLHRMAARGFLLYQSEETVTALFINYCHRGTSSVFKSGTCSNVFK